MRIYEIFRSLQGETSLAGTPMWFVRLAGCDLECSYCDTARARDPQAGREMTVTEVVAAIQSPPLLWTAITGGEPLLQLDEVNALIAALNEIDRQVMIETSGAHPLDDLDPRAVRILDIKTPGSGMVERMVADNLDLLRPQDEVKFVLTGREDYEWSRQVVQARGLALRATVLFSPAAPGLKPETLAQWILDDALPVRLNLQLHKILGLS
jgi:7-carboxy-7-deazaguanine synthase